METWLIVVLVINFIAIIIGLVSTFQYVIDFLLGIVYTIIDIFSDLND